MIDEATEARIRRLFLAERWTIGTIARELGVHHTTVRRVLRQCAALEKHPVARFGTRVSKVDPFLPFILETLERHPRLTAARLHQMVIERGYRGSDGHFRAVIRELRPRPAAEPYLRLTTLQGEQAQVDWASFGTVQVGRAQRRLSAFVLVSSYSRHAVVRFFFDQQMQSFLQGHVEAFEALGGVPRVVLYDNLKSAVLERVGDAIRYHPQLLALSGHYGFEPRPVGVRMPHEKGRVERFIRYLRSSFFEARSVTQLAPLNAEVDAWCVSVAGMRPCPGDSTQTVNEAFAQERALLMALPDAPYSYEHATMVKVGKTPYVRFDGNDYSVPHAHVRRSLTLRASRERVRLLDGHELVAEHERCYDKGQQLEQPGHLEALLAYKHQAREHRASDALTRAAPNAHRLLAMLAERGENLGSAVAALMRLLHSYGAVALESAIEQALQAQHCHPNHVRRLLEREQQDAGRAAPLPLEALPDDPRVRQLAVRPHSLSDYDALHPTAATPQEAGHE